MTEKALLEAETIYEEPVIVRVNRTVKVGGKDEASDNTSEIIEVRKFVTQPAHVKFSYPVKLSLEYQSAGVEVGIDLPCYREEVEDGLKEAIETVVARTKDLLPEVRKVLDRLVDQSLQDKVAIARGTWKPSHK